MLVNQDIKHFQKQLQELFSNEYLNKLAKKHCFIIRNRKLTASAFLKTLVFSEESHEKLSLLDLKSDIVEYSQKDISQEAIHKKFTPQAVAFLKDILAKLLD